MAATTADYLNATGCTFLFYLCTVPQYQPLGTKSCFHLRQRSWFGEGGGIM